MGREGFRVFVLVKLEYSMYINGYFAGKDIKCFLKVGWIGLRFRIIVF